MIEFDTTVRIGRTPGQVFSVLADFGTYLARWVKGPVAAVRTDGDGGRYMITARAGPATVRSPCGVTGYDPPGYPRRPFRLAPGLLRCQLQKLIAYDLGRLKDLVEAEIPHS